jgi:hypothetical protein
MRYSEGFKRSIVRKSQGGKGKPWTTSPGRAGYIRKGSALVEAHRLSIAEEERFLAVAKCPRFAEGIRSGKEDGMR